MSFLVITHPLKVAILATASERGGRAAPLDWAARAIDAGHLLEARPERLRRRRSRRRGARRVGGLV
ncbi:MAG: hypothetical protein AAGM38_13395 [Pseudomonadota bacterium]